MHALAMLLSLLLSLVHHQGERRTEEKPPAPPPRRVAYAVIVHADSPAISPELAKATIRKLFLKEQSKWPDGTEARPYARDSNSEEHKAFLRQVLGMSEAELARHWLRLKNTDGTTPPKEVDSERMMLRFVAKREGAFGIVRADQAQAEGVKVLLEF